MVWEVDWSWVLVHIWLLDDKMVQLLWKQKHKKLTSLTAMWLSNLNLHLKALKSGIKDICTFIHRCVQYNCQELEEAQMSTSEQMDNYMLCIHTVKYHAAFKMRKSLSYIIIYMNPDDTVLSKIRQLHKVKSCMIPFNGVQSSHRNRRYNSDYQEPVCYGQEEKQCCLMTQSFSLGGWKCSEELGLH